MVVVLFCRHHKMWHQDELWKNNGIQFAEQENIIIESNILQIQPHVPK